MMKKTLLCLCLALTSVSAYAGAQRDDEGLFNQSSIDQEREIKKLEKHADKISPRDKNHVGHSSPSGWKISKNPEIDENGNVKIVAKKNGKVSTATVDKNKIKAKIGLSNKVKPRGGNALSLLADIVFDVAKDMYGEIDNLAIIGDSDASWFEKFYNFIFDGRSHENLSKLKLQFDLPPHGYYWVIRVHDSFLSIEDSPFTVYDDLVIPGVGFTQKLCDTEIVTYHIGGRDHKPFFILGDSMYSKYKIYCVPSSHVGLYSPYADEYSIEMSIFRSDDNMVQIKDLINKIPDAAKVGTSKSAKNIVESMAVVDVLSGDYDEEFEKNEEVDKNPEEIADPEPYEPYYPVPDPIADPIDEPVKDPELNPAEDPIANPVADPKTDPAKDPNTDPAEDPAKDPAKDPNTDPAEDPDFNPPARPATNPQYDPATNPNTNPSTNPSNNPVYDPKTDPSTKPSTNPTNDPDKEDKSESDTDEKESSSPTTVNYRFPVFCKWAAPVCDFIVWFKEEPDPDQQDHERPRIDELHIDQHPQNFDIDYLKYGGQCPALNNFVIPIGNQHVTMKFDISPLCDFAFVVRPAILAIAYLLAMMIVGRAIQKA